MSQVETDWFYDQFNLLVTMLGILIGMVFFLVLAVGAVLYNVVQLRKDLYEEVEDEG
jgi:TRAP-type mannitol/chloroaromatic compound transport system permease small subunit